ncbi:hypothetical protein [Actinobacillus equuli]|uniref:hypothetical protein n=1 Tax=Actinobacillus equuli TaxID=718 RepID=UPI0024436CFC|nr:hypothetical protein [Actinobacillus equuli]WGE59177.1 hypothetical protein NYR73_11095 [Actinobacillus equuli subsp. haemolyticus]WGE60223.1 hypothetical protein NYR74_05575 [Actinobacillus equuli subsp. haemolyticus]WGE79343.1 hypothetical protein NYR83_10755 [Actinobacillus equuli subsp. equuli]
MINLIEESINLLEKYKSNLDENSSSYYRTDVILPILSSIKSSENEWVEKCQYLYPKYKNNLLNVLESLKDTMPNDDISELIEEIYCLCAYLLREFILYMESEEPYGYRFGTNKLSIVHNKILSDNYTFINPMNDKRLNSIKDKQLDIWILGHYFYGKSFKSFEKYESLVKESEQNSLEIQRQIDIKKNSLSAFINEKEEKVKLLAKQLEEQKTAFNFVGLSKGFEKLLSQKRWSKWTSFGIMSVFCVLLIALPIVIIGERFFNWFAEYNIEWSKIGWEQMLPILGLELVFIYFFRVALTHYNSIQTQIMQLELRQSLCQFIQSYADYAKEIKEKDGASLEKFENLIFSSILSTPDKVPSTFDGLEQLSNFIKEFKK